MTTWYRYEDVHYAPFQDEWGRYAGTGSVIVHLREFEEISRTKHGVWLSLGGCSKRFMMLNARRRFACATKEEARASFVARKKRQIRIYQARIQGAQDALANLEHQENLETAFQ